MWTYIGRRLLIMIPTLFGITIVSFCIMQLAPGDPLTSQLSAQGSAGESLQTREAFLIQKRNLNLDKPLLVNFNYFLDFSEEIRIAAHFKSSTKEDVLAEIPSLADPQDETARARRRFVNRLGIDDLKKRFADSKQHKRLADAILGFTMIYLEDVGKHGVRPTIELLQSDADTRIKIGGLKALNHMVLKPFRYTFSKIPKEEETPIVQTTWKTWWSRAEGKFPKPDAARTKRVRELITSLSAETSGSKIQQTIQDELFDPDVPCIVRVLQEDGTLKEHVIAAIALLIMQGKPLKVDVPLTAKPERVEQVAENWIAHYTVMQDQYNPGFFSSAWAIFTDTQYTHMVWRLVTFNFGDSAIKPYDPVFDKIWDAALVSAPIMLLSQLLVYFLAIPLGILCAVNRGLIIDRVVSIKLFLLYSIPNFVAAMMFLVALCYGNWLKIFPMEGLHSDGAESFGPLQYSLDYIWHITLPVVCLSLFGLAALAMYSRTSMLDAFGQDYMRTARAKGLRERVVVYKHGLRNALIPIITLFANFLPAMLGGSVLIEVLFGINGMGRLGWTSLENKDFPTLMALLYINAILVLISILITDVLYVIIDPRISFGRQGRSK